MPDDESPNKNPFVRFKQHVDHRVNAGLQNILGLPSIVSRSFAAGPARPEPKATAPKENTSSPGPMAGDDSWSRPADEDVEPRVNRLQQAEDAKDHIASVIDSFRGASREESMMGLMIFLTRSPYSPLLLDRHLGWTPSPKGDNSLPGSWSDAFDDLLRASSGLPMKDPVLTSAHQDASNFRSFLFGPSFQNDIYQQAGTYFWQLKQYRLDEVLFPYHDRIFSYQSPRTMAEWVALREAEADPLSSLQGWVDAIRKGEELWKKEVAPKVERIREAMMEEEPDSAETEEDAYRAVDRQSMPKREKEKELLPKKWDDLFDFLKHLGEEEDKPREVRVISSSERTKPTWSGGTKTITKKEYVDENGATHSETVVSVKNAEGEETSRRVSHSVRTDTPEEIHQTKADARPQNADGLDDRENVGPANDNNKPSGWFWSRR